MPISSTSRSPFVRLLAALAIVGPLTAACVSDGGARGNRPATAAAAATAPIPAPPEGPPTAFPLNDKGDLPLLPPDGKWYVDDEGQQYFLVAVPRVEGRYVWTGENSVRLPSGLPLKVARYDDTTFYVKVFRVDDTPPPPVQRRQPPTDVERAKIAATYEVKVPVVRPPALQPFDDGLPQTGQWRDGFAVADMNEDGHLDIVHPPPRKALGSGPIIFLGDGAGHWQAWRETRFPLDVRYDYGDVAVADFDRDGHLDMVLAMHMLPPMLVFGDGKGSFRAADRLLPKDFPPFSSRAIRAVDIDHDGAMDVAMLGEGMGLRVGGQAPPETLTGGFGIVRLRNDGQGTFTALPVLAPSVHGHSLAAGDFDGDGRLDLAIAAGVAGYHHLVELGGAEESKAVAVNVRDRAFIDGVAAGDLDGDGKDDLVVGYLSHEADEPRSGVDVFLSRPGRDPAWERQTLAVQPGRASYGALALGDLDGNGQTDIVAVDGAGAVSFFLGKGKGAFSAAGGPPVPPGLAGCKGYDVHLVDLDGDGRAEVVAELAGEETSVGAMSAVLGVQPDCRDYGAIRAWKVTADALGR